MKRASAILPLLAGLFFFNYTHTFRPGPSNASEYRLPPSAGKASMDSTFPIHVSGYIKHDSFWDTRQVVGARDDQVLLFPAMKMLDADYEDTNAKGQFDMSPIQTRMRFTIDGPDIKHAQSQAVIEYDFFGKANIANLVRMRHAYFILQWEKVKIEAGQDYHPLYILGADPRTLSFNTGVPIETVSRNPQFRLTYIPDSHLHLLFCASTELDFPSDGPIGFSTTYLRDSVVPILDWQLRTHFHDHSAGVGIDFKRIRPRLKTDTGLKANESLNSVIAIAYATFTWESINTRTKLIFAQNGTDMALTGGYAVSSIDPDNDRQEYTNLNTISLWNDTEITKSKSIIPGWFIGFIKSLGAQKDILLNVVNSEGTVTERRIFGVGTDINYVFRFSPRLQWKVNNFMFGVEVEYTRASYGTINTKGDVVDTTPVGNVRLLAVLFYYL